MTDNHWSEQSSQTCPALRLPSLGWEMTDSQVLLQANWIRISLTCFLGSSIGILLWWAWDGSLRKCCSWTPHMILKIITACLIGEKKNGTLLKLCIINCSSQCFYICILELYILLCNLYIKIQILCLFLIWYFIIHTGLLSCHWKRPWCWEGLGAGGEGDDRGWDGWMASLTRWTWVSVNSRSWCWTGWPGVLRFMGLQRVGHDWATDLIWSEQTYRVSQVAQWYSSHLPMQETWVQLLGQEDPMEKEMTTHSSILAWKIPWTEEPGGLQSMGSQRVRHNWMNEHTCTQQAYQIY